MNSKTNRNRLELDKQLHLEMIQLLYNQSVPASFVSIIVSLLVTITLWPVQDHRLILTWLAILTLSSITRIALITAYSKKQPEKEAVQPWEKPYFVTLMISSLIWGIGSVIIIPYDSSYHQAIVYYCLIGMSGGAVSIYFSHRKMALSATAFMMFPMTLFMFWQATAPSLAMAIGALLFFTSLVQATKILSSTIHQNFILNYELKDTNTYIEKLARTDMLTGLLNRRAFYEQANLLSNHAERCNEELAVILFDLDLFKEINDTHGHAAGDVVLEQVGKLLLKTLRKSDIAARIGGEEFVILVSGDIENAATLAEKLRYTLESSRITFEDQQFTVTASFGVVADDTNIERLIRRADVAMYDAKKSGRNCVAKHLRSN